MRQRCEYCGNWIDDTDETCPHCGAPNEHMMASAEGVPKTIAELRAFCEAHNLPLRDMRFFIGEDFREPRAFGIYQDGEDFVVYKNKADGQRAVRYRGHDEAYAVNELYQKMKSEIANQRLYQARKSEGAARQVAAESKGKSVAAIAIAFIATTITAITLLFVFMPTGPLNGYYDYQNTTYYCQNDDWYYYDAATSDWVRDDDPPTTLTESADDYYASSDYDGSGAATDFTTSPYYVPPSDTDDDWDDDDWDWDSSDTWDSGGTDWDSDW